MRRKDRELPYEKAAKLLEKCEFGVLSLVDCGVPYAVPVNYVYKDGKIFIHCAKEGKKLECISKNPNVQFVAVGETAIVEGRFSMLYESAIASGTASFVVEPEKRRIALMDLCKKYYSEIESNEDELIRAEKYIEGYFEQTAVIEIVVLSIFGKANKG